MANLRTNNLCGRGFVSVNDGTIWSNLFDGSTLGSYPATNAFDGNITTFMYPAAGTNITWNAPNGGIKGEKIEIHVYAGNTHPIVRVNGQSTGAVVGGTAQANIWVDITDLVDGKLETITCFGETIGGVARQSGFSAVKIDGEILVDSLKGSTGGRKAISGSVFFDGDANTFLKCTDSDAWDFGANNFTIEYWFLESDRNRSERRVLYLYDSQQALVVGHTNDNGGQIFFAAHDSSQNLISGSIVTTSSNSVSDNDMNQWMHVAITREGSNLKIYLNGILEVTDTGYSTTAIRSDQNDLFIGYDPASSGREFKGYLSNLRICKGHAVYTSNFTPPYEQLEKHFIANDDLTTLLCCQDSDDPTQEATGKTFTAYGGVDFSHNPDNLVKNGSFKVSATAEWTHSGGSAALGTGQSGTFGDGNHLVLTGSGGYAYLRQAITTKIGRTYISDGQSNGGDNSFISTSTSESDAVVTDIRGGKTFTATQTTLYVILRGNDGSAGNFDTVSVHEYENPTPPKVIPPFGVDAGNTFDGAISMNSPSWMYFPTGRTVERGGTRACWFRGYTQAGANDNTIDFSEMSSKGNAQDFGDTLSSNRQAGALGSSTRGVFGGRDSGSDVIEFVTFSTQSNSLDFGDFTTARAAAPGTASNGTRGLFFGGYAPNHANANIIEYITIASTGNGTDFGDLTDKGSEVMGCASPTRGIRFGGRLASPGNSSDVIDYTTIQSAGNATDFGNLTAARSEGGGASSSTRGVCLAGYTYSPNTGRNIIEYITIASTGDAVDFGDLSGYTQSWQGGAGSNNVIIAYGYGYNNTARDNRIDFITIATTGNSVDYGDLTNQRSQIPCATNGHGGLS